MRVDWRWEARKMEQLETHSSLGVWEKGDIANIEREGRRRRGSGGE